MSDAKRTPLGRVWGLIVKLYAAALVVLLCLSGLWAIQYLVAIVTEPVEVPEALREAPGRMTVERLRRGEVSALPGLQARAPMRHFHKGRAWRPFEPNRGCTAGGCHAPLPHTVKSKLATFANFHVTSLDCRACHTKGAAKPTPMRWIDKATNTPREAPPPRLELARFLEEKGRSAREDPAAHHAELIERLAAVVDAAEGDRILEDLLHALEASEPGSPVWRRALGQLERDAAANTHGEYAARLAPSAQAEGLAAEEARLLERAEAYREGDESTRKKIVEEVHGGIEASPPGCAACHVGRPGVVDFEAVGFTQSRAAALYNLRLAELMERIRRGERFHLPRLLGSD